MARALILAKLSAPAVGKVLPRTRLFRKLDEARKHPIVWIAAPPGAGKTTLVASYLQKRRLRSLWYQLDAGDNDLATFFHYLGLAAGKMAPRRRVPLPALTPEYRSNVLTFARRYFESLYGRLPPRTVLVFDNYQEVAEDAEVHAVLREGVAALPGGLHIVVISRGQPPPAFARTRAHGEVALLDGDSVRLTLEESVRLAALRSRSAPARALIQRLHEHTQGWTAGLLLLLEQADPEQARAPARAGPGQTHQVLFDYFMGEVFAKSDAATQEVLLKTALFPRMTVAMAEKLTGRSESARILAELNRKNYFIVKHAHSAPMYQYHPLFQEFLLARGRQTFTPVELAQLQHRAAVILEKSGNTEDAAALYRAATDWASLTRTILAHAPALLTQGRHAILEQWLSWLPATLIGETPWLLYWRGMGRMPFTLDKSRADLERAFRLFDDQPDATGSFLSWAGAVVTYVHEWNDFKPLDQWLTAFDRLHARYPRFPSKEVEVRATAALFGALICRQPQHPDIAAWAQRSEMLLHSDLNLDQRIMTVTNLMHYHVWTWNFDKVAQLIAATKPLLARPTVSSLTRIMWYVFECSYHWLLMRYDAARASLNAGLEEVRASGIQLYENTLPAQGIYISLRTGDLTAAAAYLEQMAACLDHNRLLDLAHYYHLSGHTALQRGDLAQALEHAQESVRIVIRTGVPFSQALGRLTLARVLMALKHDDQAAAELAQARRLAEGMRSKLLLCCCAFNEAQCAFAQGDEGAGFSALRTALALNRDYGVMPDLWHPPALSRLCVKALEAGIEVEAVRRLIRQCRLTPDASVQDLEHWPWPVKIHTFGTFALEIDGKPVAATRRGGVGRPLALLRALIALGGQAVSQTALTEALWPEAEGDAARRTFDTTLHRLRKLLPENALMLEDGKLQLNTHTVWTDARALGRELQRLEPALQGGAVLTPAQLSAYSQSVLRLYRGPFLPEEDAPWALAPREQWQQRMLQLLRRLGRYCEDQGTPEAALVYYEQGITLDPCIEEFYQRLMRLYQRLGRQAEALAAYARCRKTLHALLQITPSAATEKLYQELRKS